MIDTIWVIRFFDVEGKMNGELPNGWRSMESVPEDRLVMGITDDEKIVIGFVYIQTTGLYLLVDLNGNWDEIVAWQPLPGGLKG